MAAGFTSTMPRSGHGISGRKLNPMPDLWRLCPVRQVPGTTGPISDLRARCPRGPASDARAFAQRVRAASRAPVGYAELPGAHHDFDMFEPIRSAAVNEAVATFIAGSTQSAHPVGS
jgi:acetyl esterase/lipase